jgi:N-acetylneuraminic acid mutarotase
MNKIIPCILLFFFISGLFVAVFSPVSASTLVENSWTAKSLMNHKRSNFGIAAVDGKIYVIGGYDGSYEQSAINERYDPEINRWTTLKSMPTPRGSLAIAEYQGKIYCMGGITGDPGPGLFASLDINEVYDIATDSWSTKTSIPVKTTCLQAHVVNDKIFVVTPNILYAYDPITDVWTNVTNVPTSNTAFSVMVDNKIIIGSPLFVQYQQPMPMKIWIYDLKTDVWSEGQTGPDTVYRYPIAAGATTGQHAPVRVYVSACVEVYADNGSFVKLDMVNQVYDTTQDTWSTANPMSLRRNALSIIVVDDLLYAIDGGSLYFSDDEALSEINEQYSAVHEQYVPIGYHSTAYTTPAPSNTIAPSESEPLKSSESGSPNLPSTYLIVIASTLTIGAVGGLVFYVKKKKQGIHEIAPFQHYERMVNMFKEYI